MDNQLIKNFFDLGFTVVAIPDDNYCVKYMIYDMMGYDASGEEVVWHAAGSPSGTYDLNEAVLYLHGEVKWDGCSNWKFDEQDRVMLHGCNRNDIQRFGDVMARCWDWTASLIPDSWRYNNLSWPQPT